MVDGRRPVRYDTKLACDQLRSADPKLGRLMERAGPFTLRLKSSHSPFEALLESIVYQQLHGKAAATIHGRLLALFGDDHPSPLQLLNAPDEVLRSAGLSANKTKAVRDLASRTLDGTVPSLIQIRRMPDEEIIRRLTEVRGIGPWTVEMLLIFSLGRPDVFPLTDYGIRKGFALTFNKLPAGVKKKTEPFTADMLAAPADMARRARRWQPWRSVASWYLWRACDLISQNRFDSP